MVIYERGTEERASRLTEELRLVGFDVETVPDAGESVESLRERNDVQGVVEVRGDGTHVLWIEDAPSEELELREGETADGIALRTAEHLRGELLPSEASEPEKARLRGGSALALQHTEINVLPAYVFATYGGQGFAGIVDVAHFWNRVGVGPFAFTTITRSGWTPAPGPYVQRQTTVGAQVRVIPYRAGTTGLEIQVLANTGVRHLAVSSTSPSPEHDFSGTIWAMTLGSSFQLGYAPSEWFLIGAQAGGQLGFITGTPDAPEGLKNPGKKALDDLNNKKKKTTDGVFIFGVTTSFRF